VAERLLLRLTLRRRCNQNEPWALRTERLSLRLILRRVRQRPFVLEHLAEIAAIDPAIAGRAPDEVLGLALRGIAQKPPQKFATRNVCHLAKAATHASLPEPRGHEASP
jgi:hypothetical protein